MAESSEVSEARERLDAANAAVEAMDNPENRAAALAAWHEYLRVSDPFALEDYE